jgi:lipopolysaccharide/colanic/teichoic acid biosynthesis glycosyltransferase
VSGHATSQVTRRFYSAPQASSGPARISAGLVEKSPYLDSGIKRCIDLIVTLAAIMIFAPILALTAALIALTSRGPVLFQQERHGSGKAPFTILKFRTMRAGDTPFAQAVQRDPRVTLVGRFIRRSSIDELPQLFNVLRGDMSLVGPRPHPVPLDETFAPRIPAYSARFAARPGLTGLAQVEGARGPTPSLDHMHRRLSYDVHYMRTASLKLDLVILVRSAWAMLVPREAC